MRERDFLIGLMIFTLSFGIFMIVILLPMFSEIHKWGVWVFILAVLGVGILYGIKVFIDVAKILRKLDISKRSGDMLLDAVVECNCASCQAVRAVERNEGLGCLRCHIEPDKEWPRK